MQSYQMVSDWLISSNLVEEQNQYFFSLSCLYLNNDHEKYDVAPEEVMCCTLVEIKSWGTVGRQCRNHFNCRN